jgi:hypothetical protein
VTSVPVRHASAGDRDDWDGALGLPVEQDGRLAEGAGRLFDFKSPRDRLILDPVTGQPTHP